MGYYDLDKSWRYLVDWTSIMAKNHGGTVVDKRGKTWDWGQALCRELYGYDWMNSSRFSEEECLDVVPQYVLDRAKEWLESGEHPTWVKETR